ncbi:MAG: response regulator transcription factor, partial [Bacteroidota bacterium]
MSRQRRILLVEDELTLAVLIKDNLVKNGYVVQHTADGVAALRAYAEAAPDLIILDVMLPKANGFTVAKTIRNTDRTTPILFLTAKSKTADVVQGFRVGGNDYLRKPFALEEFLVRVRALLSTDRLADRADTPQETTFSLGQYVFDSKRLSLVYQGKARTKVTAREAELLRLFCLHPNQVLTKASILLQVWGDDSFFHSRSLDVFISRLRKYLKEDPSVELINLRGVGYKLV